MTREDPTPFTFGDLAVHTFATWGLFSLVALAHGAIHASAVSDSYGYGLPGFISSLAVLVSLVLVWVGAPVAWLVARAMRRVTSTWTHLAVFWAVGAVASLPALWLGSAFTPYENTQQAITWILVGAVLCGTCASAGRAIAFGARTRRERRAATPDPEDELLDALGSQG
ncbi:hypothetical protein ACH0CG_01755 [Microbacterium sp. 179-I 1D1 NHS]|uniref:hypothetical protein n=1 Tax=Microbacterium sp. 179-I 1D1 NHS TaxID=3374298 RepID=UPI00387A2A28